MNQTAIVQDEVKLFHKLLKEYLSYNSESGTFTWKSIFRHPQIIDKEAGFKRKDGYIAIRIEGRQYFAHRLAWFYVYGSWPKHHIDHINGNRSDNRLFNLREATTRENGQNMVKHRNGKLVGCTFNKACKKWSSDIRVNGVKYRIGFYATDVEASMAYWNEVRKLDALEAQKNEQE